MQQSGSELKDRFESIKAFLLALGDDVQENVLKQYIAFRRIKNFACIEIHPQVGKITAFVKVNPETVEIKPGFTRDVRKIGHFGTGDLEITISSDEHFEMAKSLFIKSYEVS